MSDLADVEVCRLQEEVQCLRAEIERLNSLVRLLDNDDVAPLIADTAAFLERAANGLMSTNNRKVIDQIAADCRAMAERLRK